MKIKLFENRAKMFLTYRNVQYSDVRFFYSNGKDIFINPFYNIIQYSAVISPPIAQITNLSYSNTGKIPVDLIY